MPLFGSSGLTIAHSFCVTLLRYASLFASICQPKHLPPPGYRLFSQLLRQISQTAALYAEDNHGKYPATDDVWEYAELLALYGGPTEVEFWTSRYDPACIKERKTLSILLPRQSSDSPRIINPAFRKIPLSVAVAIGPMGKSMPDTVPIAWTRGLQTDGTWADHSPYGKQGGFIVFKDTSVKPFRDLKKDGGQLVRFDGKGKTSNILEALPPNSRISEYEPTPEEKRAWAKASRHFSPFGNQNRP